MTEEKLDFKRILPLFVIILIDILGFTIIIPIMPLYAVSFRASPTVIGLLLSAYPVMQLLFAPLLGRLSDRYGRRPVLVVSQLGTLIGFVILGFADSLWMLFAARIIDGISGANIATAQAAITDSTTAKTRTQGLGLIGAAFGLGFIIGPIIAFGALAVSDNNYHVPAFVAVAFSATSILLTLFWFKETLPSDQRGAASSREAFSLKTMFEAVTRPEVGFLLVLMFAQQIAFGGFEALLALFTLERLGLNASGNAAVFVFAGVILVVVQGGLVGRWSRRYGDRKLVLAGLLTMGIGLGLTAFTPQQAVPWYSHAELEAELSSGAETGRTGLQQVAIRLPDEANAGWFGLVWILAAMIPTAIGGGITQPAINSIITRRVGADEVGGTLGLSSSFLSAANATAPTLMGLLFGLLGSTAPFLAGGFLLMVLLPMTLRQLPAGSD